MNDNWTPVSEKTPPNYEKVIAAVGCHFAFVGFCLNGERWYNNISPLEVDEVFGVTHWLKLPPPPR